MIYKLFCITENTWVSVDSLVLPTECPNNIEHQINADSIHIPYMDYNYITSDDSRLVDDRPPLAHAASHIGSDAIPVAVANVSNGLISSTSQAKLDAISANATKVETSTNGNIKIDGVDVSVYTHPLGTNPHGTTKSDVGLSNVTNDAQLKIASNLADLNDTTAARNNLQLGAAAIKNIGTGSNDVAAGNHLHSEYEPVNANIQSHISNTTSVHGLTITNVADKTGSLSQFTTRNASDININPQGDIESTNVASAVNELDSKKISSTDTRIPSQAENDALAGTNGTPSSTNKYVTDSDPRNTNSRTPTSHAASHLSGGGDALNGSIPLTTTNFGGILTSNENTIQKVVDILDDAYQKSITVANQKLQLVNDSSTPGNNKIYATNDSGVKGWFAPSTLSVSGKIVITASYQSQQSNGNPIPYYQQINSGTTTINGFIFEGTNFYGSITEFVVCAYLTSTPVAGYSNKIQWYDETNARVVSEITLTSTSAANIVSTTTFLNAPSTGRSKNAIRIVIPSTNARTVRLFATSILN